MLPPAVLSPIRAQHPVPHTPERPRVIDTAPGLAHYAAILLRNKALISFFIVVSAAWAVAFATLLVPMYVSVGRVHIQDVNESFLDRREVDPVAMRDGPDASQSYLQTQLRVMQSDTLVTRVIRKLGLDRNRAHLDLSVTREEKLVRRLGLESLLETVDGGGAPSLFRRLLNIADSRRVSNMDRALSVAQRNLSVRSFPHSQVVEIVYAAHDPQIAADFANTLAKEYMDYNLEATGRSTQAVEEWLHRSMDGLRGRLEDSERELQAYSTNKGLLFTNGNQESVAEEKLRAVQKDLSQAQAQRIAVEAQRNLVASHDAETLPSAAGSQNLREYQSSLTSLRKELANLSTTMTEENVKVRRLTAQIREIETALTRERQLVLGRLNAEYNAALRREQLLQKSFEDQSAVVRNEKQQMVRYNTLKNEVESGRQFYQTMQQRLKTASIASAIRADNIRVLDAAVPTALPSRPDVRLFLGLGAALGAFGGVALALIRERVAFSDLVVRNPGQIRAALPVSELGVIPAFDERMLRTVQTRSLAAVITGARNASSVALGPISAELVTWYQKPSPAAESFRGLVDSLMLGCESADGKMVLAVSSGSEREGKTSVVSNIGVAISEIGRKTLLVDCDLRSSRLHELFDVPNTWGVTTLISGDADVGTLPLESLGRPTGVPNVWVLPSGPGTTTLPEILHSGRWSGLMRRLREEFDVILIDTPPVGLFTDARVLARLTDGVILVVRANTQTPASTQEALQSFAEYGSRVRGVVLNDWKAPRNSVYGSARMWYGS
jgi:capsular exopolysaccharide synthesis family protein